MGNPHPTFEKRALCTSISVKACFHTALHSSWLKTPQQHEKWCNKRTIKAGLPTDLVHISPFADWISFFINAKINGSIFPSVFAKQNENRLWLTAKIEIKYTAIILCGTKNCCGTSVHVLFCFYLRERDRVLNKTTKTILWQMLHCPSFWICHNIAGSHMQYVIFADLCCLFYIMSQRMLA